MQSLFEPGLNIKIAINVVFLSPYLNWGSGRNGGVAASSTTPPPPPVQSAPTKGGAKVT